MTKNQLKVFQDAKDIIRFKAQIQRMKDHGFSKEQLYAMFRHAMKDEHIEEPEQVEYGPEQCGREK